MPRPKRQIAPLTWSHVTIRSNNRERFDVPLEQLWEMAELGLFLATRLFDVEISAMVLMPNHFHFLVFDRRGQLDQLMNYFLRELSKEVGRRSGRINHIFGNRFYSSLIKDDQYLQTVYKYIYLNPVKARLASHPLKYKYSTLPGLVGLTGIYFPVIDPMEITEDLDRVMKWLGQGYNDDQWEQVRKGLRKSTFEPGATRTKRKKTLPREGVCDAPGIRKVDGPFGK